MQGVEHQPAGTAEQEDQTEHQRGRDLPQCCCDRAVGGQPAAGAAGGMVAELPRFFSEATMDMIPETDDALEPTDADPFVQLAAMS